MGVSVSENSLWSSTKECFFQLCISRKPSFFEDIGLIKSKALQLTLSECLDIPFERSFGVY